MISVLNSVSSLNAENALSTTNAALQNALQQLSTGLKINSGADDAAGLSIANGLGANIAALTQSSQNASNGVGLLQTADGALSQVTTLLNRAVTLATEASTGGLSIPQSNALNTEFQSILKTITQIGSTTNFNGQPVFSGGTSSLTSAQGSVTLPLALTTALTSGTTTTITDSKTGGTFKFTATPTSTIQSLSDAIAAAATAGTLSGGTNLSISGGKVVIAATAPGDSLQISSSDPTLGGFAPTTVSANSATVFTSDGISTGPNATTTTTIDALSASLVGGGTDDLTSTTNAQKALGDITSAINSIAQTRGNIGASINRLTADTNVQNTEVTNLTNAQNNIQNADIASTVAKMTQYNVLEQTGMAALSQSNQAQQSVLKLLQ